MEAKPSQSSVDISVVIPLYNEVESLTELYIRTQREITKKFKSYEIVFVDDGSRDGSFDALQKIQAQDSCVKIIQFQKNYGKSAALAVGFKQAEGRIIVTMDADLQDDPSEIQNLYQKLQEGFDLVSGWKRTRRDPISKRWPSKIFNFVVSTLSGLKIHDFNCGLKAYRKEVTENIEVYGELHRFLPVIAYWSGYRVGEIPVQHHPRLRGKSKYGIKRFISGFFDLITVLYLANFTKKPLHLFGIMGLLLFLFGFSINSYFAVKWIVEGEMHVRPLILVAFVSIILGIQFISLGLIGEMITHLHKKEDYIIKNKKH